MHLAPLIHDLAIILAVAGVVTYIFQRIRQPVVLGYLIAGIIVGPHTPPFPLITDLPNIKIWAELGVIFLMFNLGLEFSFRKLGRVGVTAGLTAIAEVLGMLALGFACGKAFGWNHLDSVFLGAMLTISSTTIIVKALEELKLKSKHFAQIVFGVLIVEDLVAILLLVALSTLAIGAEFSPGALVLSAGKLLLVVGSWFLVGYFLVPRIIKRVRTTGSDELLTILSLGFCLALVVFAASFGYSVALGAFIMGSILAESIGSHRITELMQPLRDVFAAVFFVSVGMLMDPFAIWEHRWAVLIITGLTIIGKIIFTGGGVLVAGQPLKTSVQTGFAMGQIGEFSFIIATLGQTLALTSEFIYPVGVAVSVITTFATPYLIRVSEPFANRLEKKLPLRVSNFLERYAGWSEARRSLAHRRADASRRIGRWFVNGLVVSVIWVAVAEYAMPQLSDRVRHSLLANALGWAVAIALSAPFLWAMVTQVRRSRLEETTEGSTRVATGSLAFLFQFLTLVWLGMLSLSFFPAKFVGLITALFSALFIARFYRSLERSYEWFETQFLATFREQDRASVHQSLQRLAPWDAHLVAMSVHPDAPIAGKMVCEAQLRKVFGLNIVAIHRGSKTVVSPRPEETILARDELLVLGTDEQIETTRPLIERPVGAIEAPFEPTEYTLERIDVDDHSKLLGISIRQSQIRERFGGMVVGIERRGRRILNPDTDMVIEIGDRVLVVGRQDRISALTREHRT